MVRSGILVSAPLGAVILACILVSACGENMPSAPRGTPGTEAPSPSPSPSPEMGDAQTATDAGATEPADRDAELGECDPFIIDAATDGPNGVYAQFTCATLARCCPELANPPDGAPGISKGLCDDFVKYGNDIDCAG